jgi:hypothetical protein
MERWWLALVTFERKGPEQGILPDLAHGACGWMACLARSSTEIRDLLASDLAHHNLRLLELDKVRPLVDAADIEEIDDHLAANFREKESGKLTVWGTLHGYLAEGEA